MLEHRIGWLAPLALGALTLLVVLAAAPATGPEKMSQEAALEYCRAETTRGAIIERPSAGPDVFRACMNAKGY